jgi:cyclic pyranopterin phosphate synthase
VATARVVLDPEVLERIVTGDIPKGDVPAVARVAGIMAAKRTPDVLPLCHPLSLTRVDVEVRADPKESCVFISAAVEAVDRTGVEMEALTAATAAALCVYDMTKSLARWTTITDVRLEEKSGGRSGTLVRPA